MYVLLVYCRRFHISFKNGNILSAFFGGYCQCENGKFAIPSRQLVDRLVVAVDFFLFFIFFNSQTPSKFENAELLLGSRFGMRWEEKSFWFERLWIVWISFILHICLLMVISRARLMCIGRIVCRNTLDGSGRNGWAIKFFMFFFLENILVGNVSVSLTVRNVNLWMINHITFHDKLKYKIIIYPLMVLLCWIRVYVSSTSWERKIEILQ